MRTVGRDDMFTARAALKSACAERKLDGIKVWALCVCVPSTNGDGVFVQAAIARAATLELRAPACVEVAEALVLQVRPLRDRLRRRLFCVCFGVPTGFHCFCAGAH